MPLLEIRSGEAAGPVAVLSSSRSSNEEIQHPRRRASVFSPLALRASLVHQMAKTVRLGIIGVGGMGAAHARLALDGRVDGQPLTGTVREGLHSVELANAMVLSTWTDRTGDLPIPAPTCARHLQQRIRASFGLRKPAGRRLGTADLAKSFTP